MHELLLDQSQSCSLPVKLEESGGKTHHYFDQCGLDVEVRDFVRATQGLHCVLLLQVYIVLSFLFS
jgi:hypothetical protein